MAEVRWTDQAIHDMQSIADYISQDSLRYAQIQVQRFFELELVISVQPLSGRIVLELNNKTIREMIVGQYRIIYRLLNKERIDVITIHHSKKHLDPKTFRKNLKK